jgi:biopolymer transport protein ExbD
MNIEEEELITSINVTPMVDIILVLLIIFMVTTTYIVSQSIPVDLPRASTGEQIPVTTVALTLTRDGSIYLNGRLTTETKIKRFLSKLRGQKKETRAVIAADKKVFHGRVVRLIDLIRRQGVKKFAINIEEEDIIKPNKR